MRWYGFASEVKRVKKLVFKFLAGIHQKDLHFLKAVVIIKKAEAYAHVTYKSIC